jgi:hypothetical protein
MLTIRVYLPKVKLAFRLEPLEGAEPKLRVVSLPVLRVTSASGFCLSVATPSVDLAASLQIRKH